MTHNIWFGYFSPLIHKSCAPLFAASDPKFQIWSVFWDLYMSTTRFEGADPKNANFNTLRITQMLRRQVLPICWCVLDMPAHMKPFRTLSSFSIILWNFLCSFRIMYAARRVRRIKSDKWPTIIDSDIFPHGFSKLVRHFWPQQTQISNFDQFFGYYICVPYISKALISKTLLSTLSK